MPEDKPKDEEFEKAIGKTGMTLAKRVGVIASALGVVATLIGYGMIFGRFDEKVSNLERAIEAQAKLIEKLRADRATAEEKNRDRLEKVVSATRERFSKTDLVMGEMRGSIVAVVTEVRVRHAETTFPPPGESVGWTPRRVQEKLAASAADAALERSVKVPMGEDPLENLEL